MDTDRITRRPVALCTNAEVVEALNRSFEGYIVPARFTPEGYERRFRSENLDPYASYLYHGEDGRPAAAILITRRGWKSRVAAMGVATELRGRGFGKRVLHAAAAEARARGDRALLLEVFEKNEPAVALYTGLGFRTLHRLMGYRREAAPGGSADGLAEMDPLELARVVAAEGERELPWMLEPETLAAFTRPTRAYRLGEHAFAVVTNLEGETPVLYTLVVPRAHRRQGWGTRMVDALSAAFPGRAWMIPQLVPEHLCPEFLARTGWRPHELNQLEMRLDLTAE